MMEIQATITGRVQGVGLRDFIQAAAAELSLVGYAKNQPDGSVFVLAQGEPESLRLFVEYLHEGSPLAVITGVAAEWRSTTEVYDDFSIAI
jgi:acylphosphatase